MPDQRPPRTAEDVLRDLHNFVADPPLNIDALSESEVRAELKRRAIDPEASFAAMRELLDDEAAAAELAAARQTRLSRLELVETPRFFLAGLREKIHKALNSLGPQQAAATEELLRTYGWKEQESLQMFLHRTRFPANPLKHSPEYLACLLQDCEGKLAKATAALKAIFAVTDPYADGAPDASAHDKLCNEVSALARPWARTHSENNPVRDGASRSL